MIMRSDVLLAMSRLGIAIDPDELTADDIKTGFRSTIRKAHPDSENFEEAQDYRLEKAKAARDLLMAWIDNKTNPNCVLCGGTGYVRVSFHSHPCNACNRQ